MQKLIWIGIAGMVGAILRTSIGQWMGEGSSFPIATFTINMIATWLLCFLAAGTLTKIIQNKKFQDVFNTGFLGSFSTFSAFSMETVLLFENGLLVTAIIYVLISFTGGIAIGNFGFICGRKLVSV